MYISSSLSSTDIETILVDFHVSFTWMKYIYNYLRHQKKFLAEGFIYLYIFSDIQAFKVSFRDKRNI